MSFRAAVESHSRMLQALASAQVTYSRGNTTATVSAVVGKSEYQQDDGAGALVRSQVRDYLIRTADLTGSAIAGLPKSGDRITDGDDVYEVVSLGPGPAWRYSDSLRHTLRIHVRQIK